ncbi:hypothetical protein B0H63DRAFT_546141, partial [Podospora didyma]
GKSASLTLQLFISLVRSLEDTRHSLHFCNHRTSAITALLQSPHFCNHRTSAITALLQSPHFCTHYAPQGVYTNDDTRQPTSLTGVHLCIKHIHPSRSTYLAPPPHTAYQFNKNVKAAMNFLMQEEKQALLSLGINMAVQAAMSPAAMNREQKQALLQYGINMAENQLRLRALRYMAAKNRSSPKGSAFLPPVWYRRSRETHWRPMAYIKDWVTGRVRPRTKIDDMVDAMSRERRARWIEERGRDLDDDGDDDDDDEDEVGDEESEESTEEDGDEDSEDDDGDE